MDIISLLKTLSETSGVSGYEDRVREAVIEVFGRYADEVRTDACLLYTSPSPRDLSTTRMPSSA